MKINSPFQTIEVKHSPRFGQQLYLNHQLALSSSDTAYCDALVAPFENATEVSNIYVLGGGHGGVLKRLVSRLATREDFQKATLVEIDIEVIRCAKDHLQVLNNDIYQHPNVSIIIGDARYVIANTRRLNGVIVDLSLTHSTDSDTSADATESFFKALRKSLKPGSYVSFRAGPCGSDACANQISAIKQLAANHFSNITERQIMIPSFQQPWCFISAQKPVTTND
ncbi:MAG: hypothetical protein CSA49_04350 [Gammaproteobacteria bacterium]|nr:MAG: hypothetical protein CSA49_04350 [Gammaproteobacteria bacterium]